MNIENGFTLMMVGIGESNPTYIEFYRVDGILALRNREGIDLSGHPGIDCKFLPGAKETGHGEWAVAYNVTYSQARKISKWSDLGLFIAVGRIVQRNKNGIPRKVQPCFSYRRGEKYLSSEDIAWLHAYREASFDFTDKLLAVTAIASWLQFIAKHANVGSQRAKKHKKVKRKEQKRMQKKAQFDDVGLF